MIIIIIIIGFLANSDSTRNAYCTVSIDSKIVATSSTITSLNPSWNEFFQFRWTKTGIEMQFIIVEVWDKGRRVGGDELVGRCRVPLVRMKEIMETDIWHMIFDKDGRKSHSRLRLTIQKSIIPNESITPLMSPPPPRAPYVHPILNVVIPFSVKFHYISGIYFIVLNCNIDYLF